MLQKKRFRTRRALARQVVASCLLVASSLLAACDEPVPTATRTPAANFGVQDASTGVPTNVRPEEAAFADLSRQAPSAAGFYFEGTGVTVRIKDAHEKPLAQAAIQALAAGRRLGNGRATPMVTVKPAQFTFKQLAAWRDVAFDIALVGIRGVNSLDLDEVRNRVALGIDPQLFPDTRAAVVTALTKAGVDSTALAFDSVGSYIEDFAAIPPTTILDQSNDPLAGGLEIAVEWSPSSFHACTLGFVATRNSQVGLVTASHCTSGMYGTDNNPVHQLLGRTVGTESADAYGYTCGFFSECRGSDAAFFASSGAVQMGVGLIHKTQFSNGGGLSGGFGSFTVDQATPYFIVTGEENGGLVVGQEVHKIGRTTGWTRGDVKQTCVDYYPRANYLLRCGYETHYVAGDGDSGAPVFSLDFAICSRCVTLLGIHSGRKTPGQNQAVFSKLHRIKSDLGGTWVVTRPPSLATPVVSASVSGGHPVLSWNAVAGAQAYRVKVYYQEYYCDPELPCVWRDRWDTFPMTTALSFTDNSGFVSTTCVSPTGTPGERLYWVMAEGVTDFSTESSLKCFQP